MSVTNLRNVLLADGSIRALCGDRIDLAPGDEGIQTPFITYEFENNDPVKDLNGVSNLKREDWVIYVTDTNFLRCTEIKDLVIDALSTEKQLFSASIQQSDYEKDASANTHRFDITFTIFYYT